LARRTLTWQEQTYRLVRSTWHFWGQARLIQLPGDDSDIRMTPDEAQFVQFAMAAGFEPEAGKDDSEMSAACQVYLAESGHQVWTVSEALQLVRDDVDKALTARLMDQLIHWFFLEPF